LGLVEAGVSPEAGTLISSAGQGRVPSTKPKRRLLLKIGST
jgi:hypothetical protein